MYGCIILSLVLAIVAIDLAEGPPPDVTTAVLGAAAVAVAVLVAGLAISLYIRWRSAAAAMDEQRFLRRVGLLGRLYRLLVVTAYGLVLFGFRWAALGRHWAGDGGWLVVQLAIGVAPLVVIQTAAWISLYSADRRLRAFLFERAGAAVAVRHWTFLGYLEFMFRQHLLIMLVPLVVLVAANDAVSEFLGPPERHPLSAAALVAFAVAAIALSGPWFRLCWRTEPLPESALRDRLQALADRAGVRIADILVWRTNVTIANGCMVGVVAPLRYILVTDALLLSLAPEEIEAVFAHEVAHIKFRHVGLYMLLALGGASAALVAGGLAAMAHTSFWTQNLVVGAVLAVYWGVGFGYVSRRCEQQCDLYAARATLCPVGCATAGPGAAEAAAAGPGPAEHQEAGVAPQALPAGICRHRVIAFATALRRIARLNGSAETAWGWRHFSMARRCEFLDRVLAHPSVAGREERFLRRVKWAVVLGVVMLVVAAGVVMSSVEGPLESDHPENPAGPEDGAPRVHRCLVRLVDGNEVHAVAFGSPQLGRDPDATPYLDHGGHAGFGRRIAAADDDIAVEKSRGHAVAVAPEGEGAGFRRR